MNYAERYFHSGLLLALPRLRKLYFANMKAVMEELSKVKNMSEGKKELSKAKEMPNEKEEITKEEAEEKGINVGGPFLLEHFDSSEYSLAVPGEGSRPEVRIVWMDGEGFNQRPVSLTLRHLGSPYHGEVSIRY